MTYVILETCIGCKYTDCVENCPVDAFHEGPEMLYINPEECIDCNACVADCPVEAVISDEDLEEKLEEEDMYRILILNAEGAEKYPVITEKKPAD